MPVVYFESLKTHINRCVTCQIAGRVTSFCNAGYELARMIIEQRNLTPEQLIEIVREV